MACRSSPERQPWGRGKASSLERRDRPPPHPKERRRRARGSRQARVAVCKGTLIPKKEGASEHLDRAGLPGLLSLGQRLSRRRGASLKQEPAGDRGQSWGGKSIRRGVCVTVTG